MKAVQGGSLGLGGEEWRRPSRALSGHPDQITYALVIDGLNEAEDPRRWKTLLAGIELVLQAMPNVLVACTLRSAFKSVAVPDGIQQVTLKGFEYDGAEARKRYFDYYRIDATDALLPKRLLDHPLGEGADGAGELAVVYDALAGYIVADAMLDEHEGIEFEPLFKQCEMSGRFDVQQENAHPLASDIFEALVHLSPRRRHRQQLWPILQGTRQEEALLEAAWLDAAFLDGSTVEELKRFVKVAERGQRDLFARVWATRAAQAHPLNARFLDSALRELTVAARDLRWTEWV
jgi:hypothetical protein